jgi:ribosomal-protein-alanine N-acetyltransferase
MLIHKGTQMLETKRLILRKTVMDDALPMFRNWACDPEVTKFLTWPPHPSVETTAQLLKLWIEESEKPDYYQWMIVLKEIEQPIGTISVVRHRDDIAEAEIGYCIGRTWWHRGIMSEALNAVIDYLFAEVGMNRITAKHDTNNPHSGGVMRKCSMTYEGTHRASDRNNQGICDTAVYAVLRRDWPQMSCATAGC